MDVLKNLEESLRFCGTAQLGFQTNVFRSRIIAFFMIESLYRSFRSFACLSVRGRLQVSTLSHDFSRDPMAGSLEKGEGQLEVKLVGDDCLCLLYPFLSLPFHFEVPNSRFRLLIATFGTWKFTPFEVFEEQAIGYLKGFYSGCIHTAQWKSFCFYKWRNWTKTAILDFGLILSDFL